MVNVFLTVDTELWPHSLRWPQVPLDPARADFGAEIALYLNGATASGEYGIAFQIDTLNRFGLKGCFFVEALSAGRTGPAILENLVGTIQRGGHEVQLHLHTEWLGDLREPSLPSQFRQFMYQFGQAEQVALVRSGLASLQRAGATQVCAFRAGSFGANHATLGALAECGVAFDSSYNATCLHPDWNAQATLEQPVRVGAVWEFPVTTFRDYPGHRRHAQLCACSFTEMKAALLLAWQQQWYAFVIVLHSFELVKNRRHGRAATPDHLNIARFEHLCGFLAAHRDKFSTRLFRELDPDSVPAPRVAMGLRSPLGHTIARVAEQAWSRRAS